MSKQLFLRGRPEADGLLLLAPEPNFDRTTDIWGQTRRRPVYVATGIAVAAYNRVTIAKTVSGEDDGEGEGPEGAEFDAHLEGTNGDSNDPETGWFPIITVSDDGVHHEDLQAQYLRVRISDFSAGEGEGEGESILDVTLWCD